MLQWLRKYSRSWFIALAIGAIVVVFIFWGVGSFKSPRFQEVASVNGMPIMMTAYLRQYNELIRNYQERTQVELTEETIKALRFKEQALNQLINEVLLMQAAERLGISVTTAELQDQIRRIPYFQEDGQFSERRYRTMLSRSRLSPTDFEVQERSRMLLQKFIQAVTSFAKVSDGELQQFFQLAREQVAVHYLVVSPQAFMGRVNPSDAEVAAYYQQHQAEFRLPERARVRYVLFKPQPYVEQVELSPKEIDDYLRDHAEELVRPKTIRVRELFLAWPPKAKADQRRQVEQKARDLLVQAQAGADFITLVRTFTQHEQSRKADGDLGYLSRGQNLPDWEKVAFSLNLHEVGLAITPKGCHLLRLEEIKETERLPEAEARGLATQRLRQEKSRRLALEAAQQARGDLADTPFPEVARKFKVTLKETPVFSRTQTLPDLGSPRAFMEAAFRLQPQEISRVVDLPAGYAILQCQERLAATDPPLEAVKDQVRLAVKRQQAQKLASQEADRLLERLRKGEQLTRLTAQAALPLRDSGLFTRGQGFLQQPQAEVLTSAAFALSASHPYPPKPLVWQDNYYLLAFKERKVPTAEDFRRDEAKLRQDALNYKRQLIFEAWLSAARQQAKINIYELPS